MILRRLTANLRAQNWTAIAIELFIVVIGVFVGMLVANWNQARLEKEATQRMLVQLIPELRSQLEFFENNRRYYATTRRFAAQALAGWKGDPGVSDEQFVVAAYQASQITGIGFNPDSWSLTFGGEQLRNIEDVKVRRNLALVLTNNYSFVDERAVATPYREQIRHVIPVEIQDHIRRQCGDRSTQGKSGANFMTLPATCTLGLEPAKAAAAAAALRARPKLVDELNWHLAQVATYRVNAEFLERSVRALHRELTVSP